MSKRKKLRKYTKYCIKRRLHQIGKRWKTWIDDKYMRDWWREQDIHTFREIMFDMVSIETWIGLDDDDMIITAYHAIGNRHLGRDDCGNEINSLYFLLYQDRFNRIIPKKKKLK